MNFSGNTGNAKMEENCLLRFFSIDVSDSNTRLVSLEPILVSAGKSSFMMVGMTLSILVLPISQPSSQMFWKSGWTPKSSGFQKVQNHVCILLGSIENSWKCRKKRFFSNFTVKIRTTTGLVFLTQVTASGVRQ